MLETKCPYCSREIQPGQQVEFLGKIVCASCAANYQKQEVKGGSAAIRSVSGSDRPDEKTAAQRVRLLGGLIAVLVLLAVVRLLHTASAPTAVTESDPSSYSAGYSDGVSLGRQAVALLSDADVSNISRHTEELDRMVNEMVDGHPQIAQRGSDYTRGVRDGTKEGARQAISERVAR
ncbi:MAG TPA: hypothetical protein VGO93_23710 [Candidatus Xenobia bacterium]|jgi:hypothetical protein